MNIHFVSPQLSIGDGANAVCQLAIGDTRADGAGSSDITEDYQLDSVFLDQSWLNQYLS